MMRELRARRRVCQRAQTALEGACLTVLLMASVIAVPLLAALLDISR